MMDIIKGSMEKEEWSVDVRIYLPFMKTLIKKYGNFKVSQELHDMIIYNLCEICDAIEDAQKGKQ